MTEKAISGFPGYTVTDDGSVYSMFGDRGRLPLAQHLNSDGYPTVRLRVGPNTRKRVTVHRLVANEFLPPPPPDAYRWRGALQIRHLDGDKSNNSANNLAWGTHGDNANDREEHGRTSRGNGHSEAIRNSAAYKAHKRLIAAAPDLLEALEFLLEDGFIEETVTKARAAIAKAKGEAE